MNTPLSNLEKLVQAIHATPHKVVIEFAGAGAQALTWLHSVGGSSRTILEATDRYASASLIELIGFEPKQFTSRKVARVMANAAFVRASFLAPAGTPVAGIGCTATITTDRQKRGEHRCCVAVCNTQGVVTYEVTLSKGPRTRSQEEELVSLLILRVVAQACELTDLPELPLQGEEQMREQVEWVNLPERLIRGDFELIVVSPEGHMTPARRWPKLALLSGAFNPLHHGHRQLAKAAASILGQEVYFELPLINAAKGRLDLAVAHRRIAQFTDYAPLILTRAPLYSQKAEIFPRSVFVVGADKVEQLFQPKFYNNDPAEMKVSFDTIREFGCRFLVGGRLHNDHFVTLEDVAFPVKYQLLFESIPEEKFRVDVSSTEIREG